jgi:flavin-dependent dehydrogenase
LPLDGMIVTGRVVRVVGRYGNVHGGALLRRDLDARLVAAAAAAGARIEERVLVEAPLVDSSATQPVVAGVLVKGRDGRSLRVPAPLVIAADGRYSRVARAVGLSRSARRPRRWALGAYFQDVTGMSSFGEMHVRRTHYLGVAPLPNGLTNACIVTADASRQSMKDLLLATLRTDLQLSGRFAAARMVEPPLCLGPLAVDGSAAGIQGLLLAGDAAGFVDPITGDGLRFAFRGGELAALEALRALEHGAAESHVRLLAARTREFAAKWRFNRGIRTVVGFPATVEAAEYGAGMAPFILRRMIRYAADVHAA